MENPDLVLQETGSRPTYSRLNYVLSGDTLRRDAISSFNSKHYKPCKFSEIRKIFTLLRVKFKVLHFRINSDPFSVTSSGSCTHMYLIISRRPIGPVREIIKCPLSVRACMCASVRHVFTEAFLSLKLLKLELPNLQDAFIIGKTCQGIFFSDSEKQDGCHGC